MKIALLAFILTSLSPLATLAQESASNITSSPQSIDRIREEARVLSLGNRRVLRYKDAKTFLFGELFIQENSKGEYFIKDVYCEKTYNSSNANVLPNSLPNQEILNCEHTWPQSKFIKDKLNKEVETAQLTDLHHLFPAEKNANQIRANYDFQYVIKDLNLGSNCTPSKSGQSAGKAGNFFFEPPTNHKGNVARAMFYFSTHYKLPIDALQEKTLREWHKLDPIDADERERNNKIEQIQGNRNPYIDYPELVEQIKDF